jgi:hypothetical protein
MDLKNADVLLVEVEQLFSTIRLNQSEFKGRDWIDRPIIEHAKSLITAINASSALKEIALKMFDLFELIIQEPILLRPPLEQHALQESEQLPQIKKLFSQYSEQQSENKITSRTLAYLISTAKSDFETLLLEFYSAIQNPRVSSIIRLAFIECNITPNLLAKEAKDFIQNYEYNESISFQEALLKEYLTILAHTNELDSKTIKNVLRLANRCPINQEVLSFEFLHLIIYFHKLANSHPDLTAKILTECLDNNTYSLNEKMLAFFTLMRVPELYTSDLENLRDYLCNSNMLIREYAMVLIGGFKEKAKDFIGDLLEIAKEDNKLSDTAIMVLSRIFTNEPEISNLIFKLWEQVKLNFPDELRTPVSQNLNEIIDASIHKFHSRFTMTSNADDIHKLNTIIQAINNLAATEPRANEIFYDLVNNPNSLIRKALIDNLPRHKDIYYFEKAYRKLIFTASRNDLIKIVDNICFTNAEEGTIMVNEFAIEASMLSKLSSNGEEASRYLELKEDLLSNLNFSLVRKRQYGL